MKKVWKVILGLVAVLVVALAVFLVPTIWGKPWSIDHFYGRVFGVFALRHPMMLSGMRLLEPMGLEFHNDDLDDFSMAFAEKEARWVAKQLEILRRYDRAAMDRNGQLSYDVLEWFLADSVEGDRWRFHDYPVNQLFGVQSSLPDFMINTHHLADEGDAEDYIARVGEFGVAFDQVLAGLAHREELGIVPPLFVIRHVLEEMRDFIGVVPDEQVLYTHFAAETGAMEDLGAQRREELLAELEREIEGTVYPAYERLIGFFEAQEKIATTDDGVWKLPEGEAFYAHQLRHYTTTEMSAAEIHQLGLAEVEAIHAEMREILEAEGYPTEDLGATMQALNEEERFLYPDTDEGRRQILADYQAIIDEVAQGLAPMFNVVPEAEVAVERVPEFKQATAPGAYYQSPPFDGSKPGIFYANLRDVKEIPKFGMRTLAYHEAIPGHHFQIAIAQELEGVPFFRRVIPFTAFSEGWALYAEKLAAESGFQEDPYDRLGYLTGQVFRAARLVVDTGLHAERWTREQAIEYMLSATGMPETDVIAEVERYIVNPGQATAYKVGQLEILRLREEARAELGAAFDLRGFHDVVLTGGALPLSVLRREVEAWVAEQLAS
ncbi:MAG: DUF885 domain-containing protein [Thermoanaerobaculia bacterium]|nr:DUF885 domain-containing protein [Thermoanaerobaculia bacterium]